VALLGAAFQIGRSALAAYQSAIALAGQNIANLGNANYTRQTGRLSTLEGGPTLGGVSAGGGVLLSGVERHVDEAVESRLRMALGSRAAAESSYKTLGEIEALYNELSEHDLSTQLTQFFNTFGELENDPQQMTTRQLVLANADAVARTLRRQRGALLQQAADLNHAVEQTTEHANTIAGEIASLNELVVVQQARGSGFSSALRDRRDGLLRELAELMDIQVREQSNGSINVYVGSEPLVEFGRSRGLRVETELEDGLERAAVRFADNNGTVVIRDGRLAAQLAARDEHLSGQVDQLDQLARALVYEVNRVQSTGRGLVGYTTITSAYAAGDVNAALDSSPADLEFPVRNGSFVVHVRNRETGQTITRLIEVDLDGLATDTTLSSLAQDLSNVPGLSASVTADGRLQLDAADGSEMWFTEDTSGVLAALGVGGLFQGSDAGTIGLQAAVRADPRLIAASLSGGLGDGSNAGRLALLGDAVSDLLGQQTIAEFQAGMVSQVATRTAAARMTQEAADAVYSSLLAQRESVSGVSLDEEAINLTKFERAFQGATRYLSVLDNLSSEVLALVR